MTNNYWDWMKTRLDDTFEGKFKDSCDHCNNVKIISLQGICEECYNELKQ